MDSQEPLAFEQISMFPLQDILDDNRNPGEWHMMDQETKRKLGERKVAEDVESQGYYSNAGNNNTRLSPIDIHIYRKEWEKAPLTVQAHGLESLKSSSPRGGIEHADIKAIYGWVQNRVEYFVVASYIRQALDDLGKEPKRGKYRYSLQDIVEAWLSIDWVQDYLRRTER